MTLLFGVVWNLFEFGQQNNFVKFYEENLIL